MSSFNFINVSNINKFGTYLLFRMKFINSEDVYYFRMYFINSENVYYLE